MGGKCNNETVLDGEKKHFIKATIHMHISQGTKEDKSIPFLF